MWCSQGAPELKDTGLEHFRTPSKKRSPPPGFDPQHAAAATENTSPASASTAKQLLEKQTISAISGCLQQLAQEANSTASDHLVPAFSTTARVPTHQTTVQKAAREPHQRLPPLLPVLRHRGRGSRKLGTRSGSKNAPPRRTQQRPLQHRSLRALPSPYRARDQALPTSRETASRVISKAAQRRARALQAVAVVTDPEVVGTALYRPSAPGCSFRGSPRLALVAVLPGQPGVVAVHVYHRRNIVAADVASLECLHEPLTIAELNGIPVTAREPADRRVSTGFVYGHLTDTELLRGIISAIPVSVETMEGGTVKLHFSSLSPPNRITIFGLQLRVRPVRPRPRQCRQCGHLGHVTEARQRPSDFVRCGRRHLEANFCKPHCVNGGGAHFATNTTCPMWQEERRVATLMATTPTLLSRRAVRPVVGEERREVRSYAVALKASPPPGSKAPSQPRTTLAPRQLSQPAAPSTEVKLPAAQLATPAEDERDAHIRILVTTLKYGSTSCPKTALRGYSAQLQPTRYPVYFGASNRTPARAHLPSYIETTSTGFSSQVWDAVGDFPPSLTQRTRGCFLLLFPFPTPISHLSCSPPSPIPYKELRRAPQRAAEVSCLLPFLQESLHTHT
ncbi:hypothetical protein HPB51_027949 [Rhipicephalus microplus]|uniref:Tick transposon n=1 Tax=Rhipicephalus microplus TaxID=6941 RepID=A0A9J6CYQ1_RHIMP|nr:hypothetical protein HPB51_027949 [Rhipicephalus microplus]